MVHIFTKSSGKTALKTNEFRLPKECQIKKMEKNNDLGAFEPVTMRSLSSWLVLKHQTL